MTDRTLVLFSEIEAREMPDPSHLGINSNLF